jgi:hypothetical protein
MVKKRSANPDIHNTFRSTHFNSKEIPPEQTPKTVRHTGYLTTRQTNCFICFYFRPICCSRRFARHFDLMISRTLITTSRCRVTAGTAFDSVPTYCSTRLSLTQCFLMKPRTAYATATATATSLWALFTEAPRVLSALKTWSSFINVSLSQRESNSWQLRSRRRSSMATVPCRVACNSKNAATGEVLR